MRVNAGSSRVVNGIATMPGRAPLRSAARTSRPKSPVRSRRPVIVAQAPNRTTARATNNNG